MTGDFPIGALILPDPPRTEAWRRWRADLELDALSYECLQTLPALAGDLPRWLEGDPCAARINGIVRMAWTRNQVRLNKAAELHEALLRTSVFPVAITGPLAWSLRPREAGSIRTIPDLTLLIPREYVFRAVAALTGRGWTLRSNQPDEDTLHWSSNLAFTHGEETLHLHWRLFPGSGIDAVGFERECMRGLRTIVWNGIQFHTLAPEFDLLHRLAGRPQWDPVPWQVDGLMMPFAEVDWKRFRLLAGDFQTFMQPVVDVIGRLMELRRSWQLPIPEMKPLRRGFFSGRRRASNRARFAGLSNKLHRWRGLLWRV
jgi:hypothetical protein